MYQYTNFYIDGAWVKPKQERTLPVINPATEQSVGIISLGSAWDANRAVMAARKAFAAQSVMTRAQRLELLQSIISVYKKRMHDIAMAVTLEMGAPFEKLAKVAQAPIGLAHFMTAADTLKSFEFEYALKNARIVREPIGVCALITPWNWPLNQLVQKIAPAIATGCTMVLKPSELAPLSAYVLAEVLHEAGVPAGVFNLVNGDGLGVGAALSIHPEVDMISFTGSTRAGIQISKAAAETVKKVSLELGGKSANIITDDADMPVAVTHGVRTLMMNTGQSCNAPSRMLVPKSRLAEVEALAISVANAIQVGDPVDPQTTMGPLANEAQFGRVQNMIALGVEEGATLLTGGTGRPDGLAKGYFAKPTIFSNVSNQMAIAQQEIFGPVLCILPYDTVAEAIGIANDTPYGLSGYVFAATPGAAAVIASQMRTGNVHLNGANRDPATPFGGYKQSGIGREGGAFGFEEFLETKSINGFVI